MRTLACLFAVSAVGVGLADTKDELKALTGTWVAESAELDGADLTKAFKDYVLTLDGDKYELDDKGRKDKGTVVVDGSKSPKHLDLTGGPTSPLKGKTIRCIYAVKDGKLTVCYGMDFKTRPAEFKTAKDSKQLLVVYKPKK
ncbi:MAG: TIGR03067 domain-containing protein [Gemmataceae bacterium]